MSSNFAAAPRLGAGLAAALLLGVSAAGAQDVTRYTMERTEDGYVRLDSETGEMSLCRERGEQLVCQMAADDRRAFESELDALSDRVAALEAAIGESDRRGTANFPTEEEIDRTMGMMETFMRRFFAIIDDLNRDFDSGEPDVPERTAG